MKAPPMTASIKEALKAALSFLDGLAENAEPGARHPLNSIIIGKGAKIYADQLRAVLASLSCGEARERIAFFQAVADGYQGKIENGLLIVENPDATPENFAEVDPNLVISADAILATGCVPGEALQREYERGYNDGVEWNTTGWDRARNSGRILLVWREFSGIREHVELGRYSDSKSAWVNTYGNPFNSDPDGWAPLLPFKSAAAIRADERERCAKVAEELRATTYDLGVHAFNIAAAIRSGGGE